MWKWTEQKNNAAHMRQTQFVYIREDTISWKMQVLVFLIFYIVDGYFGDCFIWNQMYRLNQLIHKHYLVIVFQYNNYQFHTLIQSTSLHIIFARETRILLQDNALLLELNMQKISNHRYFYVSICLRNKLNKLINSLVPDFGQPHIDTRHKYQSKSFGVYWKLVQFKIPTYK